MLGPRGSGKTIYLASLFNDASQASRAQRYVLNASSLEKGQILDAIYEQVADPNADFPEANQIAKIDNWEFDCSVPLAPNKNEPMFHFTYYDYAGELTKGAPSGNESTKTFEGMIHRADIIMAMIDGVHILRLMRGDVDELDFETEYRSILREIQNSPRRHKTRFPVHFVISKWDLLQKNGYSLGQVIKKLREIRQLRNFMDVLHEEGIPVRFIPVSSLGESFVETAADGKTIGKRPGHRPAPFQIQVPLACAVIDSLNLWVSELRGREIAMQKSYDQEIYAAARPEVPARALLGELLAKLLSGVEIPVAPKVVDKGLSFLLRKAMDTVLYRLRSQSESRREEAIALTQQLTNERDWDVGKLTQRQETMVFVIKQFSRLVAALDAKFDDSLIQ